jgi:hypothetical protein
LEIEASIDFGPPVLDAAGNLRETISGLATQNWKFDCRRQLLTSALPQRGVEYSMFDVGLSRSFPTCLASIEAGQWLTLEFPALRGDNSPRRCLLQNHSDVGMPAIGETMSTDQVHLERRASQRFDFQLPVAVRLAGTDREGCGFTQDLSGRGAFFYTDFQVGEGDTVELTFVMPAEITLTENMRVRCRGRVTRVLPVERKFGVAVHLEGYEYLSAAETVAQAAASFPRVSGGHDASQNRKDPAVSSPPALAVEG